MDIQILVWINTAIIIFALIAEPVTMRAALQALRKRGQVSEQRFPADS